MASAFRRRCLPISDPPALRLDAEMAVIASAKTEEGLVRIMEGWPSGCSQLFLVKNIHGTMSLTRKEIQEINDGTMKQREYDAETNSR